MELSFIVGGGDNATILHYHTNSKTVADGELVLVDAGVRLMAMLQTLLELGQ